MSKRTFPAKPFSPQGKIALRNAGPIKLGDACKPNTLDKYVTDQMSKLNKLIQQHFEEALKIVVGEEPNVEEWALRQFHDVDGNEYTEVYNNMQATPAYVCTIFVEWGITGTSMHCKFKVLVKCEQCQGAGFVCVDDVVEDCDKCGSDGYKAWKP